MCETLERVKIDELSFWPAANVTFRHTDFSFPPQDMYTHASFLFITMVLFSSGSCPVCFLSLSCYSRTLSFLVFSFFLFSFFFPLLSGFLCIDSNFFFIVLITHFVVT
jgi:hypothetical protein